jgi:autoinducer 2-degrading protein
MEDCDEMAGQVVALPSARRAVLKRVLSLVAGFSLLSTLTTVRARAANGRGAGPAIVNVVTFRVPDGGMARFLAISKDNSDASVKEPGCISFEVLLVEGTPNTAMLIETYRDEAGYQAHRVTPHFLAFVKASQEIGAKRSAHVGRRYYPA